MGVELNVGISGWSFVLNYAVYPCHFVDGKSINVGLQCPDYNYIWDLFFSFFLCSFDFAKRPPSPSSLSKSFFCICDRVCACVWTLVHFFYQCKKENYFDSLNPPSPLLRKKINENFNNFDKVNKKMLVIIIIII